MAEGVAKTVTYTCRICGTSAYCEIGLRPTCWAEAMGMGHRRRPYKHGVCRDCARPAPGLSGRSDGLGGDFEDVRQESCSKEFSPTLHTVKGWFRTRAHTLTWKTGRGVGVGLYHDLELLLIVGTWGPNPTSARKVEQARESATSRVSELSQGEGRLRDLFALASHRTLCCRKHAQAELCHLAATSGLDEQLLTRPLELPDEPYQLDRS
jgi:hypothetical protein